MAQIQLYKYLILNLQLTVLTQFVLSCAKITPAARSQCPDLNGMSISLVDKSHTMNENMKNNLKSRLPSVKLGNGGREIVELGAQPLEALALLNQNVVRSPRLVDR